MTDRRFIQCDVFTPTPTRGNALAVVIDGEGLDDATMQTFAAWTNLAETTFILHARSDSSPPRIPPRARRRRRLRTPDSLPYPRPAPPLPEERSPNRCYARIARRPPATTGAHPRPEDSKPMKTRAASLLLRPLALTALGALAGAQGENEPTGPGPVQPDIFNPEVQGGDEVEGKAYGGRIIVHLSTMPENMNKVVENSAVVTWMYYAVHESLLHQDWETWEFNPRLAKSYETEDMLVLKSGAVAKYGDAVKACAEGDEKNIVFGKVEETDDGYVVRPVSKGARFEGELQVAKADVESLERGTVLTFSLREGVPWHDGHLFDANDLYFTWSCYWNPDVDCDETRSLYGKIVDCEVVDDYTVRYVYKEQFYSALETIAKMPVIARHVYDLTDPDNAQHNAEATPQEVAANVNDHPNNHLFIGLGPYKVTKWDPQYIEAQAFDGHFSKDDPKYGGYLDTIRWRYINDDNTAFQAAINGELDLFVRVKSTDYFGEATETEAFKKNLYKGYLYTGTYGYTSWNLLRPIFKDVNVRKALAHAFDMENYRLTNYKGLAKRVTGPAHRFSPAYNHDVKAPEYDPDLAEELLAEAGWYDRDGDDIIDKDGVPFEFEFLFPSGNEASKTFGIKYQEALANIGVKMNLANLEWATFLDRVLDREFDAINLAWVPDLESDPEQLWHSKWANPEDRTSNHAAFADDEADRLIEALQRELDRDERMKIWNKFHARVAELHPYIFMLNPPRKFALNKRFRGFKTSMISPGYALRQVYLPAGAPGTRATR